ncbi:MAG: hypothetical protein V3R62_08795 [Acidiferrobacterales bacterium]
MGNRIITELFGLIFAVSLALTPLPAAAAEPWLGGAYGRDVNNFDPMGAISFEGGMWPKNKQFGFQGYLEFADPACDDDMWTVGIEPIWRYKRFYAGIGLALSDERLCGLQGIKWSFSMPLGFRISKHIDVQWRHRSHGADFGIRADTPNKGVNLIQIRVYTRIGSPK